MLRKELQSYIDRVYPGSQIDTEHTLKRQVYIRFELGDELPNGTKKRVNQAVDRALGIFEDAFQDSSNEIFVLIYDYMDEETWMGSKISDDDAVYIYQQFPKDALEKFYNQVEVVNLCYFVSDENGNEAFEQAAVKIVIGKLPVDRINIRNILNGIANAEMGFAPRVHQRVYFFDPINDKAFQMYDDRGCDVWSDAPDKIRNIYGKRNDWIVDYNRPEIDLVFAQ